MGLPEGWHSEDTNVQFEHLIFKLCTYCFRPTDRPCQQVVNIVVFIQIKCYSSLRPCWLWILEIVAQYSWRKYQWGRLCYKTFSKKDTCFSMGVFPMNKLCEKKKFHCWLPGTKFPQKAPQFNLNSLDPVQPGFWRGYRATSRSLSGFWYLQLCCPSEPDLLS